MQNLQPFSSYNLLDLLTARSNFIWAAALKQSCQRMYHQHTSHSQKPRRISWKDPSSTTLFHSLWLDNSAWSPTDIPEPPWTTHLLMRMPRSQVANNVNKKDEDKRSLMTTWLRSRKFQRQQLAFLWNILQKMDQLLWGWHHICFHFHSISKCTEDCFFSSTHKEFSEKMSNTYGKWFTWMMKAWKKLWPNVDSEGNDNEAMPAPPQKKIKLSDDWLIPAKRRDRQHWQTFLDSSNW